MSGREGRQEQQNCPSLLLTRAVPSSEAPNFTGWVVLQILGLKTLKNPSPHHCPHIVLKASPSRAWTPSPGGMLVTPEVGWVGLEPGKG